MPSLCPAGSRFNPRAGQPETSPQQRVIPLPQGLLRLVTRAPGAIVVEKVDGDLDEDCGAEDEVGRDDGLPFIARLS